MIRSLRLALVAALVALVAAMALAGAPVASAHAARIDERPRRECGAGRGAAARQRNLQRADAARVRRDDRRRARREPVVERRSAGSGRGAVGGRSPARPVGQLHGELPGDVGGRPPGIGFVDVSAHGLRDRHTRSVGRKTRRARGRRRNPGVALPGGGRSDHRLRDSVDGAAKDVSAPRAAAGGVLVVLGASAAAWALAYPQAAPAATVVRALADCAAAATLGLAVVPMLDAGRYRDELTRRASGPLAWAAGFWLFAELCRLVVGAADAAAIPVTRVGLEHDRGVRDGHLRRAVRRVQRRGRSLGFARRTRRGQDPARSCRRRRGHGGGAGRSHDRRPHVRKRVRLRCDRDPRPCRRHVVRNAGRAGVDGRTSGAVGPCASALLRTVAVVCDRIAGRWRDRRCWLRSVRLRSCSLPDTAAFC